MTATNPDESGPEIAVDLTDREWFLLDRGLTEWGGAAQCTDALATAMGFQDVDDLLHGDGRRIHRDVRHHRSLSRADWVKALMATEIVFASDVMGSGTDWSITTGLTDESSIALLRSVQQKLGQALGAHR